MATEQNTQQQHAQWLASLASEHFVQQAIGSVSHDDLNEQDNSQTADNDPQIVDMSGHTVVKLIADPAVPTMVQPTPTSPFNLRKNLKKRKIDHEETERHTEYKLIRSKERVSAKTFDMRRPVRPIDRQKMRPWLKNLLDTGSVFGLNWMQREDGIFQISWRHASRLGWNLETDGDVFERWARHTGIFKDGDEPEPKRWKANFRCALHSLPDVKELTSPTDRKGRNASRTYRFLRANEIQPPVKRKQRYSIQIPYLYERQASDDSGSQQADSDDRNTDEEVAIVPEQVQTVPHCDHDYAIRAERQRGEQSTSEILSRHNSGYVLIKSKDAHEFEFRLTPPHGTVQTPTAKNSTPASSSPQKKGKNSKKKAMPSSSPSKKGKGKLAKKAPISKKDRIQVKKVKKSSKKEPPSPATKVSLRALLSGRKNSASARRAKGGQAVSQTSKKAKGGKKTTAKGRGKQDRAGSGAATPTQSQGLEALLEAANQIEGMVTRASASASASAPANPAPRATSKRTAAQTSVAAVVTSTAMPAIQTTVNPLSANIAAPVMFTTKPMMLAGGTTGTTLTPVPVLASVQPTAAPAGMPSQVSLTMLQKFLGLSAAPTVPTVPATVPLITVPAQQVTQVKTPPSTTSSCVVQDIKNEGDLSSKRVKHVAQAPQAVPTLLVQPEEGTSMLKHLLQLTVPSGSVSSAPATNTTSVSHIIPAAPKIPHSLLASSTTVGSKLQGASIAETADTHFEFAVAGTTAGEGSTTDQPCQIVEEIELGTSQETEVMTDDKNFPYTDVNTSQVYTQPEGSDAITSTAYLKSEGNEAWSNSSATINSAQVSQPQLDATTPAALGFDLHQSGDGTQAILTEGTSVPPVSVSAQQAASAGPQVTLCLPQALSGITSPHAFGAGGQTMTLTLPQTTIPTSLGQGQGNSATFTHSMDLLQFLNLCAASGNGQVIIKTEPPASDIAAMSNAYSPEKAAPSSQPEGDASMGSRLILMNSNLQTPATHSAMPSESQLDVTGQQECQINPLSTTVDSSVLLASDGPHAFSAVQGSSALSVGIDSAVLAGVESVGEPVLEGDPVQTVTVSTAGSEPLLVLQEGAETEIRSASGMEAVPQQFIINEAGVASLSGDPHETDCYVVKDVLL